TARAPRRIGGTAARRPGATAQTDRPEPVERPAGECPLEYLKTATPRLTRPSTGQQVDNQDNAQQRRRAMRTITLRRSLVALFAAAISFGAITHAQAETLRIGYQKYGTLVLLKAKGTLEKRLAEQGVEVKWTEFPGGPQLLEGLNVGSVDFGVTGETPPVFAQAAGADLLYVAHEPPAPTGEAILVPKDSSIKSVAELKGKKVALNKGSNVHYLLVRALEDAGLKYSDIQPVYLPPADARAAFERGSVDAWVIWDPFQSAAEKQLQARNLRNGLGIVDNNQFYLATKPYAQQHPKVIQA